MTIVKQGRAPRLSEAMEMLSKKEGSPCHECLVKSACKRSFVDGSACYEFAEFVQKEMVKAGMLKDKNKQ